MRVCYENVVLDGLRVPRIESVAATFSSSAAAAVSHSALITLFTGTADGALMMHDCRVGALSGAQPSTANTLDILRKQPKEKKPILQLTVVESWRLLIGIMDGVIVAYDLSSFQQVGYLPETRGCALFSAHDKGSTLVVGSKKKISIYLWQGTGFVLRKDIALPESLKCLTCTSTNVVVLGHKRYFEAIDLISLATTRVLDFDNKDNRMICFELPALGNRRAAIVLSAGQQGVVFDVASTGGQQGKYERSSTAGRDDRIDWSAAPHSVCVTPPFLCSLLPDSVEVHDASTLLPLQRLKLSVSAINMSMSPCVSASGNHQIFVSTGDSVRLLKMVPLSVQVLKLVDGGEYEEAINLCKICPHKSQLSDIDVPRLHENLALVLFQKGDYEAAVANYIIAGSTAMTVLAQFPDFVPGSMRAMFPLLGPCGGALHADEAEPRRSGAAQSRAAAAVVQFCESCRAAVRSSAERAERIKGAGIGAPAVSMEDALLQSDPDDAIRAAELVDTVLLSALVHCSPPRRSAVIELLSSPAGNRCNIECCSVILAQQGVVFTEALIWLNRSKGEHKRVLQLLSEDRCVGAGAWTREQFYQWMSDYLFWLWQHADPALPSLVLAPLKLLLEFNPEMGLFVLTAQKEGSGKKSFGGKGVSVHEVLEVLASAVLTRSQGQRGARQMRRAGPAGAVAVPLVNGRALGVAYLEWLVSSGSAPPIMHDEYALLLIEGIPLDGGMAGAAVDHAKNDLEPRAEDSDAVQLYKIYRMKLQFFLESSGEYHPDRLLKVLPRQLLHEYALLLSRQGLHEDVLSIYIHQLGDAPLAQAYCDRIYSRGVGLVQRGVQGIAPSADAGPHSAGSENVYSCLFRVLLRGAAADSPAVMSAIAIAQNHYDRIDAGAFVDLLPRGIPLCALQGFLAVSAEYHGAKRRNLQIVHQLLRVREVKLRTGC